MTKGPAEVVESVGASRVMSSFEGFWVQAALGASHWAVPLSFWRNSPQYMGVAL